jgi:vacuolar-type H+-ATPase subunit H
LIVREPAFAVNQKKNRPVFTIFDSWYKIRVLDRTDMQEIVNKVLEAERQAEQTLAEARQKSSALRGEADAQAAAALQQARAQAQELLQAELAEARAEAERSTGEQVRKAHAEAESFLASRQEVLGDLVERVVQLAATPEYLKG